MTVVRSRVRVGTRQSALALRQADIVATWLTERGIAREVEIVRIVTHGDREGHRPIADVWGTGVFSREIDEALSERRIDIAVHSLKDLPIDRPPALRLAAVPTRVDSRDALIARDGATFSALPSGATVGTSSPRRQLQLGAARGDLVFHDMRGNVDTRVRAVQEGRCDAVVLGMAGLVRLGRTDVVTETFAPEVCTPAPGQGALAVEAHADDAELCAALTAHLDDARTRACVTAERAFLAALGGGCRVPVGAFASVESDVLSLIAAVSDPTTKTTWRGRASGTTAAAAALGADLAAGVRVA